MPALVHSIQKRVAARLTVRGTHPTLARTIVRNMNNLYHDYRGRKMKTKKGAPTFKISLWGQFVVSLGLICCFVTVYYAYYPSEFAGHSHNCILKSNGSIACWGDNSSGQSTPPTGNDFTQISVGWYHSCALKSDGSLACWGYNNYLQSIPPEGNDFTQVSAGWIHNSMPLS